MGILCVPDRLMGRALKRAQTMTLTLPTFLNMVVVPAVYYRFGTRSA
jgi:hypothetical protein